VYPEHKHRIVEALQGRGRLVGMTGDGVNDAPALKKANVGIAVAGATPAAKGAADIILTEEGIGTIITAISRSRMIFRRLETYILYRVCSSLLILGFFFFAIVTMSFEIPTWVLVVVSITNDVTAMFVSFDKVHTSDVPELFHMGKVLCIATGQAAVGVLATTILLYLASPGRGDWWHIFGFELPISQMMTDITPGEVVAVMYLALTALIQLNLLTTRNPSFWWRFSKHTAPPPSLILLAPMAAFLVGSTFISVYWPDRVRPDGGRGSMIGAGWAPIGIVWAYVFIWWQISDLVKVVIQKVFRTAEAHVERCKRDNSPLPGWVAAMDKPNQWASRASDIILSWVDAIYAPIATKLGKNPRRTALSQEEFRSNMSMAMSMSRMSGVSPTELRTSQLSAASSRKSSGRRVAATSELPTIDAVAVDLPPPKQA